MRSVVVVGAGIFGVTAALELAARGWAVTVLAPTPVPDPAAASNDVSKAIRADYGADSGYARLALEAEAHWQADPDYRATGVIYVRDTPMASGGYEFESRRIMQAQGVAVEPLDAAGLGARFGAFQGQTTGYFNPRGGWARSGRLLVRRWHHAQAAGVELHLGAMASLFIRGRCVAGVTTTAGDTLPAQRVVIAAGAATPWLVPELAPMMWASAHPVLLLRPDDVEPYQPAHFPVWAANIAETGLYGFPALPDGTVKVAMHAEGRRVGPDTPHGVPDAAIEALMRERLAQVLPKLARAPRIGGRWCRYSDTLDGDLWIDAHPDCPGLIVAAGGSGHAFKFAPLLGPWIADAVEGRPDPVRERFGWRAPVARREASRALG